MVDKNVRLDITARDDASKVLDDVADEVEGLEDADPEVTVTVDDEATKPLGKLSDSAERLMDTDWVVQLRADTARAKADAADLQDRLEAIERDGVEVPVDVDTTAARGHIDDLDRSTKGTAGSITNTFRDLGGPLGTATGQAADFGEAFETAGAMAAAQFGLSGAATTAMTAGLGAIGIAVGVISTLWQAVKKSQEEANKRVEDYKAALDEANGSLAEAARIKLADTITDDQVALLQRFGLNLDDVVKLMQGRAVPEVDRLREAFDRVGTITGGGGMATINSVLAVQLGITQDQAAALRDQADGYKDIMALVGEEDTAFSKAATAHERRARFLDDGAAATQRNRDRLQELNTTLDGYTNRIAGIPPSKHTDVSVTDNGTADATGADIDHAARDRDTKIRVEATGESLKRLNDAIANATKAGQLTGMSTTNVTVNMARGARYDPGVVRLQRRYARRNGGRP